MRVYRAYKKCLYNRPTYKHSSRGVPCPSRKTFTFKQCECVRVVGGKRKNTQDAQMAIKTFVGAKKRGEGGVVDKDINTRNTLFIIIRGFVLGVRHGETLWFIGLANS